MRPLTLILDFDGTVARADVGDELCDRFGDPTWRQLDAAWERGEISLPDAQREMWARVRAPADELLAYALACGQVRAGLDELLAAAAARGAEVVLASGGFDFYIEAILGDRLRRFDRVLVNRGEPGGDGGGVRVSFPHRATLGCPLCAVCKGRVCDEARAAGRQVVFVGDGTSDRCAIGRADALWAVRGSKLAAACRAAGQPFRELDSFAEITLTLIFRATSRRGRGLQGMTAMAGFEEREKIEVLLHPEKRFENPPAFQELPINEIIHSNYEDPYQRAVTTEAKGALGSATRHITGHYDTTMGPFDPDRSIGSLNSEQERYAALNGMTQQQSGGGDVESPFRCGASVLLAGSLLAGGGDGIATLINSVETFKTGQTKGPLDEATQKRMEELDKLKLKIARGKELTAGDLAMVTDNVFDLMKKVRPDGSKSDGMLDDQVTALMASSPELRKMWKENDLSYDSVDMTGAGKGGHAVLGIGHGKDDKDHVGPHQAIYDPYHRVTRDVGAIDAVEDAQQELKKYDEGTYGYAAAQAKLNHAYAQEKASRKEAGQLITDATEVATYKQATDKSVEFNAPGQGGINFKSFMPANIWAGQY